MSRILRLGWVLYYLRISSKLQLSKFLEPTAPIATRLDKAFLAKLLTRADIPSEAEARSRARATSIRATSRSDDVFGFESTPGAKALPVEFQEVALAANEQQLADIRKTNRAASKSAKTNPTAKRKKPIALPEVEPLAFVPADSFYMELNATKGAKAAKGGKSNIPGEQRIPLPAIWSAQEFWGWRENYTKSVNPRKGKSPKKVGSSADEVDRVYWNWYSTWDIAQVGEPSRVVSDKKVRMYFYENSSDFRVTCGELARWGEPGDIIRLERVDDDRVDFKCWLAKKGSNQHKAWSKICEAAPGSHTQRSYGFS